MLRRVVKDHSDIKKSLMMRTTISVWDLKEKRMFESGSYRGINILELRRVLHISRSGRRVFESRAKTLQIDRSFLSF
ncbi:hypothetical protein [Burkholderia territorii]|uniref:hypothetical protein n=1 Tax=Burkholderia territorii TaxID=1503055 RepID=UPI000B064E6B|nr:hypothetical protein [Burkholderia territorii]